ncbi:MAG TPA: M20/M25/M40 family metallo-hydrolase [Myxococcota bacterium]|nr:M20/M25/M40 family metallo-hydrolase [Myxococcota bacterium]
MPEVPDASDWGAVRDATAGLLASYVRIDTSNPPGDELRAARFVARFLEAQGIEARVYESAPGRGNVCGRLRATAPDGRGAILLLHHLDVVPADPDAWSFPPFSGAIRDGFVYGRGAIDDKGHGAIQLVAFALLARSDAPRARDVVLCATAAEETRGEGVGVDWMLAHHPAALGPPVAVWNEGGGAMRAPPLGDRPVAAIAVSEKRGLWLTLVAEGEGGHGSQPIRDSANRRLVRALARIDRFATPWRVPAPVAETLDRLAGALDFPWSLLSRLARHRIFLRLAGPWIEDVPMAQGFVRDTIALTRLDAGFKHNVIPRRAEASLDVRLLPETDAKVFLAALEEVIDDPNVRIEVPPGELPGRTEPSPWDDELFRAIETETKAEFEDALVLPIMMTAGTDSKFFREIGIPAYGFIPGLLDRELTASIHGLDERIPVTALETGVRVTYRTLGRLVAPSP